MTEDLTTIVAQVYRDDTSAEGSFKTKDELKEWLNARIDDLMPVTRNIIHVEIWGQKL